MAKGTACNTSLTDADMTTPCGSGRRAGNKSASCASYGSQRNAAIGGRRLAPSADCRQRCTVCFGDRSLEADARAAPAELLRVDVLGNEVLAIGELRSSEGVEQQFAHVARRHACETVDHRVRRFCRERPIVGIEYVAIDGER